MATAYARPKQANLQRFPLFNRAGCHAAELWFEHAPPLSMADWRDRRFRNLIAGDTNLDNFAERRAAFNDAFARRIAAAIVRAEVRHA